MVGGSRSDLAGAQLDDLRPLGRWRSQPTSSHRPGRSFLARVMPGANVTFDNRAGAGGIVGTATARNAPADGHSILLPTDSTHAANVSLYAKLGNDPIKDFELVCMFCTVRMTHSAGPLCSPKTLIDFARRNPNKLSSTVERLGFTAVSEAAYAHCAQRCPSRAVRLSLCILRYGSERVLGVQAIQPSPSSRAAPPKGGGCTSRNRWA